MIFTNTTKTHTMDTLAQPMTEVLEITASDTSSSHDFDFLAGKWIVRNQRLKERLNDCEEWEEFNSELHMRKTLTGLGNVENYYTTFNDKPFEGMAVRLFNPNTRLWTIYWIDSNGPVMDQHPVTGSFENGIGNFYARDNFKGKEILVIYRWDATNHDHPTWSQAFSVDNGKNWEWNWKMVLTRME